MVLAEHGAPTAAGTPQMELNLSSVMLQTGIIATQVETLVESVRRATPA